MEQFEKNNLLIKGNNLVVLHSLKHTFASKVRLIYIDPPYNTGKEEFNYNDNFNHSTWLTFMKNRLEVARDLLREDGIIFVQCDDSEQSYLRVLMDGIFGRDNFVSCITYFKNNTQNDAKFLQKNTEFIFCFFKNKTYGKIYQSVEKRKTKVFQENDEFFYEAYTLTKGGEKGVLQNSPNLGCSIYYNKDTKDFIPFDDIDREKAKTSNILEEVYRDNKELMERGYTTIIRPPKNGHKLGLWTWSLDKMIRDKKYILIKESSKGTYSVVKKEFVSSGVFKEGGDYYIEREVSNPPKNIVLDIPSSKGTMELSKVFGGHKVFSHPKSESLLQRIIQMSTSEGDIVLDFFAGSGTTLAVAHKMNRQWIGIEQMDYIEDITKVRLEKVIEGEQGGVSKSVGWNGGGEFVYLDLEKSTSINLKHRRI